MRAKEEGGGGLVGYAVLIWRFCSGHVDERDLDVI